MADTTDGFDNYEVDTVDPGPTLLVSTVIVCVLMYAFLPCMVSLGKRYDKKNQESGGSKPGDNPSTVGIVKHLKDTFLSAFSNPDPQSAEDENNADPSDASSVASPFVEQILDIRLTRRTRTAIERRQKRMETDEASLGSDSVLGSLEPDDVSFNDAVDANDPAYHMEQRNTNPIEERGMASCFDRLLEIVEWDYETKRIVKLAAPFIVQAFLEGTMEVVQVALIAKLLGTNEVTAYVTVDLFVGITGGFLKGIPDSLATLCGHSIGVGNRQMTGNYLQMTTILYIVLYLPTIAFWYVYVDDVFRWLGYSEEVVRIGADFTQIFLWAELAEGINDCIHGLLDVSDHEIYSTVATTIGEMAMTAGIVIVAQRSDATLRAVGWSHLVVSVLFLVANIVYVACAGWFRKYYIGIFGSNAFADKSVRQLVFKMASANCVGWLLAYGEWEILAIFATFLGPAEVAAWAILGSLWDALEYYTEAIADAAEVRCAYLLGAGQPENAKLSSFKSITLGFVTSLILTATLFIVANDLPSWLTKDATLQQLVSDLLPIFGIGNIALTLGTMAWTLVGAQGRLRLSTSVGFVGSWLITMPLAAVFSIILNFDLQGQTAAVVIGYMVSGTMNTYILLRSDWDQLSRKVVEENRIYDDSSSDEDEDDEGEQ